MHFKINIVLCGGIGQGAKTALAGFGIHSFGGVTGNADEAVKKYLSGQLEFTTDVTCAYRIGQTKNVLVYQLLMKNTIEAKIYEMQKRKKEMSDIFVENSNGGISTLSKEELRDLFSME